MSTKTKTEKYLNGRKTGATANEIAKGIKGNVNTVRRVLGEMVQASILTVSDVTRKCKSSGIQRHTYYSA